MGSDGCWIFTADEKLVLPLAIATYLDHLLAKRGLGVFLPQATRLDDVPVRIDYLRHGTLRCYRSERRSTSESQARRVGRLNDYLAGNQRMPPGSLISSHGYSSRWLPARRHPHHSG